MEILFKLLIGLLLGTILLKLFPNLSGNNRKQKQYRPQKFYISKSGNLIENSIGYSYLNDFQYEMLQETTQNYIQNMKSSGCVSEWYKEKELNPDIEITHEMYEELSISNPNIEIIKKKYNELRYK